VWGRLKINRNTKVLETLIHMSDNMWHQLLKYMLKEEYRFHVAITSKSWFLALPVLIWLFSYAFAVLSPIVLNQLPLARFLLIIHTSIVVFGISMGALAFLGPEIVERRFGRINLLIMLPQYTPIRYNMFFFIFYLKEIIFYIALTLTPMTIGLIASMPITGFSSTGIAIMFLAVVLSFLIGIAISFMMATIYIRHRFAFICALILILAGIICSCWLNINVAYILPSLGFQLIRSPLLLLASGMIIIVFTTIAMWFVHEPSRAREKRAKSMFALAERKFAWLSMYVPLQTIVAKEYIDLKRSHTLSKIIFNTCLPLVFVSALAWFVETGLHIPVGFNIVFYANMVGFFGILIYSWLNNIDPHDWYQTLPISVAQVIKGKLILYILISSWLLVIFVVIMALWLRELQYLWLALIIMYITALYIGVVVAYLTGLRPNTRLFNMVVLAKFTILSIIPMVGITVLSFLLPAKMLISSIAILCVCVTIMIITYILYSRLDLKWAREEFRL
jgi:hypothetical protein